MSVGDKGRSKLALGIFFWISLAFLMLRDVNEKLEIGVHAVIVTFLFGLVFSYYIVAYLFGWLMPTITFIASLVKGKNDILRAVMFIIFICFWLWGFWSF
ncbi:hypothetical protein IEI94_13220 [Halomonas sp. ML-15]|uniref:hypothetical protein n=1 Tax=Halomonas sp. ML-15 TaxID=2773305 RepID=UPI0017474023|nr:hypothetical protein [Halomonas sp. ML-15]MBD3896815.1 hypothetical protein [Halomonas sp. ML-15]